MAKVNKVVFKVKEEDKTVELAVIRPTAQQIVAAQQIYSSTFHKSLLNGDILREALDKFMIEQGLWDDSKQKEFEALETIIKDGTDQLIKGGIKKSDAKNVALSVKLAKLALNELLSTRNNMYDNTVEGKSENMKFNYLVSVCTVYNDNGNLYFNSLDDYLSRSEEAACYEAAANFANLYYSIDPDYEKKLPENRFLSEFGFMDADGHLINAEGKRTDLFGRLVDNTGRLVNDSGEEVDYSGNKVDFEFQPFLDDDGEPLTQEIKDEPKEPEPKKKRGRKKLTTPTE